MLVGSETQLRCLARIVEPLDRQLLAARPVHHVPGMKPALIAFVITLLDWPDKELPQKLVDGFEIVGRIPPSNIFCPVEPQTLPELPLLGADAARYVDQLESDLRVHPSATLILEEACKEQSLGLVGPFQSRSFFDALYGPGNWRPLKRHTVHQGDKERPIDDGRAGRHNECTLLSETIVNQRPDFPTAVVKYWGRQLFARLLS